MAHLLDDEAVRRFLTEGLLVIQPDAMTEADHDHLYQASGGLYERAQSTNGPTEVATSWPAVPACRPKCIEPNLVGRFPDLSDQTYRKFVGGVVSRRWLLP